MRDITLKIVGKQCFDDKEEDQMEFITDGKIYLKDGSIYLLYDESEVSGMTGCKTSLKITDNSVKMKRIGDVGFGAELYFENGVRAAAPGQFAVFYVNGAIAGSGRIEG